MTRSYDLQLWLKSDIVRLFLFWLIFPYLFFQTILWLLVERLQSYKNYIWFRLFLFRIFNTRDSELHPVLQLHHMAAIMPRLHRVHQCQTCLVVIPVIRLSTLHRQCTETRWHRVDQCLPPTHHKLPWDNLMTV